MRQGKKCVTHQDIRLKKVKHYISGTKGIYKGKSRYDDGENHRCGNKGGNASIPFCPPELYHRTLVSVGKLNTFFAYLI
jgi:hypothetical protein